MAHAEAQERFDVVFVARKGAHTDVAGTVAHNVDKATAIDLAKNYCHRTEANEGVMIVYHGTTQMPQGSEWWFHC